MTSRTSESWDAGWHITPGQTVSRVSMMGLRQSHEGFSPWLTCGYACQKANGKDRHFAGDCQAASLRHLGGAQLAPVGERVTMWLPLLGAHRGLIVCCHQTPWGEPLHTGAGSPGNKLSRFVAGAFPVQSRTKQVYVSNLCCMSLVSPTSCQGDPSLGHVAPNLPREESPGRLLLLRNAQLFPHLIYEV